MKAFPFPQMLLGPITLHLPQSTQYEHISLQPLSVCFPSSVQVHKDEGSVHLHPLGVPLNSGCSVALEQEGKRYGKR